MDERTERIPGVSRARVTLRGRPRRLRATFSVRLEPDAVPADVVRRIDAGPVADARTSGEGTGRVDAVVRLRAPVRGPARGIRRADTTRAPLL
ncbi:hypothetical protein OG705_15205 [Streptomyces sp. NBC_00838]|uniref:hypothetical protein n=1 Tax=Streptomyces sp. NBC_00838 TaxID=2903680 RepID=UPI00386BAD25|nr:hypothetical protein OG705_15205 [Streptomyces sp. NBC_00838]